MALGDLKSGGGDLLEGAGRGHDFRELPLP